MRLFMTFFLILSIVSLGLAEKKRPREKTGVVIEKLDTLFFSTGKVFMIMTRHSVRTRYGRLEVRLNHRVYEGAVVHQITVGDSVVALDSANTLVSFLKYCQLTDRDIVVVRTSTEGGDCPINFRIIELQPDKWPIVTPQFGTCGDDPEITTTVNGVILRLPDPRAGGTRAFWYAAGSVSETN